MVENGHWTNSQAERKTQQSQSICSNWDSRHPPYIFHRAGAVGCTRSNRSGKKFWRRCGYTTIEVQQWGHDRAAILLQQAIIVQSLFGRVWMEEHLFKWDAIEGRDQSPALSWPAFLAFWRKEYSNLIIASPREDICGDCWIFANRHKYLAAAPSRSSHDQNEGNFSSDTEEDCRWEQDLVDHGGKATIDDAVDFQRMLKSEELIETANQHVQRAKR